MNEYVVIPLDVINNLGKNIAAIRLYVVIQNEVMLNGDCKLTNSQFSEILNVHVNTINDWLLALDKAQLIDKIIYNDGRKRRAISLNSLHLAMCSTYTSEGAVPTPQKVQGSVHYTSEGAVPTPQKVQEQPVEIPTKSRRSLSKTVDKNDENQKNDYISFNSTNNLVTKTLIQNQNQNINSKSKDIARTTFSENASSENLSRNHGDKKPKVDKQSKLDLQKKQSIQLLENYTFGEIIDNELVEFIENTYISGKQKSVKSVEMQLTMLKELKATDADKINLIRTTISKDWAALTYEIENYEKAKGNGYGTKKTSYDSPSMALYYETEEELEARRKEQLKYEGKRY